MSCDVGEVTERLENELCLTSEEKPEKTSPRKLVPNEDRTRARCVTGAHATAWPTAVDCCLSSEVLNLNNSLKMKIRKKITKK